MKIKVILLFVALFSLGIRIVKSQQETTGSAPAIAKPIVDTIPWTTYKLTMADFRFENLARISKIYAQHTTPPVPPANYVNYPAGSDIAWQVITADTYYDRIKIKIHSLPQNSLSEEEKRHIRLYEYTNGIPTDITSSFNEDDIFGVSHATNSIFALVAPMSVYDKQGPITEFSAQDISPMPSYYNKIKIKIYSLPQDSLSAEESGSIKLYEYNNRYPLDNTTNFNKNEIFGILRSKTSKISVVAPIAIFDKQVVSEFAVQDTVTISTSTSVEINAYDASVSSYAIAGVATTYYLIDKIPTDGCFSKQQNSNLGQCAKSVYTGPFTLTEGSHKAYAVSIDKAGNYGKGIYSRITVDGTKPITSIYAGKTLLMSGATAYITAIDSITITAQDPISKGVSSGIALTNFLIDISQEECDYAEGLGGINCIGSCEFHNYTNPFTLPCGEHAIYYFSTDKVKNQETEKNVIIKVDGNCQQWSGVNNCGEAVEPGDGHG